MAALEGGGGGVGTSHDVATLEGGGHGMAALEGGAMMWQHWRGGGGGGRNIPWCGSIRGDGDLLGHEV